LWLRHVDKGDAQPIAGSDDLTYPFWSPDSRYIGFFAGAKLKKVDVSGGAVTDICPAGNLSFGASWSPRGVIVFSTLGDVLKRVPENGGTPERINGVPLASDAIGHHWPVFLPDGIHFVYLEWRYATPETHQNTVWVGSLNGDKARRLPLDSTNVQYASGYLLFSRDGDLFAEKFDPQRLELSGLAIPIARNIQYDRFVQAGAFSVSDNGVLVYAPAGTGNSELTWVDRSGKALATLGEPGQYILPSISPDGKRVAVGIKPPNASEKIWIYDVDRGTRVPLDPDESGPPLLGPVWSPDGKHLLYRNLLGKRTALLTRAADGSGEERQVGQPYDAVIGASDWSKDGRYLSLDLTRFMGPANWHDSVIVIRAEDPSKQLVMIDNAGSGKFSPDGHWLAYSDETSGQLYVTALPGPGARIAVSSAGGWDPRWRGDGQELFYVADDLTLVSARVRESAGEFHVLSSQRLFRIELPMDERNYDVSRDGNRFLVTTRTAKEQTAPLTIMTNWTAGLQNANK
jgi:Tol biopolymer transport system component